MAIQDERAAEMERNLALYPWFKFAQSLLFWQAVWFLYFQQALTPAAAIALYAVYDISVTLCEVPLGVLSDRIGRKRTLIASGMCGAAGAISLALGDSFAVLVLGQVLIGAGAAFASGTDSALLYESLAGTNRAEEVEQQETRALQYTLWGFAVSAALGGAIALWSFEATFWLAGLAMLVSCTIAFRLTEPPHRISTAVPGTTRAALRATMAQPVLRWIFVLVVVMYGFSHLPFVFGQPFIAAALQDVGLSDEAPLVSGGVSAIMMGLSLVASLFAVQLRGTIGLTRILLLAFGMQIALITVLAITQSWIAIVVLFLRIVPDALSGPFIMGRIQPLLRDEVRATYVSVQNLSGKLAFSVSLLIAAGSASNVAEMPHADIQTILTWYILAGAVIWLGLALSARSAGVEVPRGD